MSKSHVSMEQRQCIVCTKIFDTNSILLDKRLRNSMEKYTITGTGLCPDHKDLYNKGFIALVGVDPVKSKMFEKTKTLKNEDAYRTGTVAHIKAKAWCRITEEPIHRDSEGKMIPMYYVEEEVLTRLNQLAKEAEGG